MRVLLVEDNADDIELAGLALARSPLPVLLEVVTNGRDGLARILAPLDPPDLVLLDINLPVMDGFQVLERLAAEGVPARVPIVVLSTSTRAGDFERATRLGARELHSKFVKFEDFVTLMCRLVDDYFPGAARGTDP